MKSVACREPICSTRPVCEFADGLFDPPKNLSMGAIGPRAARRGALVFDAQAPHRQREVQRNQSTVIVTEKRLRQAENTRYLQMVAPDCPSVNAAGENVTELQNARVDP